LGAELTSGDAPRGLCRTQINGLGSARARGAHGAPGTMPAGAGWKTWRWGRGPFVDAPTDPVAVGGDSKLTLE
jgi:hypothetical protein